MLRPEGLAQAKHPPAVYGALLKDHYVMDTFHFHWGLRNYRGSEHRVNGIRQVDNINTCPKFHQCKSNPITGLDRPLGIPEVEAHGGKVVSPTHRPPLPPTAIVRPERLCQ
jgi:hypothetical protein